jgi:histidyl-tRNA synthetase
MKFQCPRGTRDFYPETMAIRNWIVDRWRAVSVRNGFEEYDGPIFESLDLYRVKSGEEIVSQLFHFEDRGGREFAIRPEMTPTLARMVAAKANALPRPVKWFSTPRLCRAERPQRGRLREFFQWNIDILGEDSVLADAECIFVAVDFFRSAGLTEADFEVRINSRSLLTSLLELAKIAPSGMGPVLAILDKRDKVSDQKFSEMVSGLDLTAEQNARVISIGEAKSADAFEELGRQVRGHEAGEAAYREMVDLFAILESMGVDGFCRFDMGVVRGLAYYTGIVFEAFGKGGLQRAIAGGGRYDRLLKDVGGPDMSATGFATSDVVIEDLLRERDKLPDESRTADVFVIDADETYFGDVLKLVSELRTRGHSASFSYKRQNIGKQMKQASGKGARRVAIVDDSTKGENLLSVKDMSSGNQQTIAWERFVGDPMGDVDDRSED